PVHVRRARGRGAARHRHGRIQEGGGTGSREAGARGAGPRAAARAVGLHPLLAGAVVVRAGKRSTTRADSRAVRRTDHEDRIVRVSIKTRLPTRTKWYTIVPRAVPVPLLIEYVAVATACAGW